MHASECKDMSPVQAKIVPDFGDSPLSCEWKRRITDLVNSMPDVLALHDLDYSHTDKVKHHINLSDNTPFKQRARPIHPQNVDAVRRHLKERRCHQRIRISLCLSDSSGKEKTTMYVSALTLES